jgi:hypothetical protein
MESLRKLEAEKQDVMQKAQAERARRQAAEKTIQ